MEHIFDHAVFVRVQQQCAMWSFFRGRRDMVQRPDVSANQMCTQGGLDQCLSDVIQSASDDTGILHAYEQLALNDSAKDMARVQARKGARLRTKM